MAKKRVVRRKAPTKFPLERTKGASIAGALRRLGNLPALKKLKGLPRDELVATLAGMATPVPGAALAVPMGYKGAKTVAKHGLPGSSSSRMSKAVEKVKEDISRRGAKYAEAESARNYVHYQNPGLGVAATEGAKSLLLQRFKRKKRPQAVPGNVSAPRDAAYLQAKAEEDGKDVMKGRTTPFRELIYGRRLPRKLVSN